MNIRTVQDLLVDAVKLDRETHEHIGPRRLRGQQIAYTHDFADMAGWGKALGDRKCQLTRDDADPYGPKGQLSRDFWDQFDRDPTPQEIARADRVHGWLMYVDKPEERRALIGWANSKAGGKSFRRWCLQIEGISQTAGLNRKNRAVAKIQAALDGRMGQHDDSARFEGLLFTPEISDLSATIAEGAGEIEGLNNWAAPDAVQAVTVRYVSDRGGNRQIDIPKSAFSWAEKHNQRRRQREAKKRKQREAA